MGSRQNPNSTYLGESKRFSFLRHITRHSIVPTIDLSKNWKCTSTQLILGSGLGRSTMNHQFKNYVGLGLCAFLDHFIDSTISTSLFIPIPDGKFSIVAGWSKRFTMGTLRAEFIATKKIWCLVQSSYSDFYFYQSYTG